MAKDGWNPRNHWFPLPPQGCSRCGLVRKCGDPGYCPYGVGNEERLAKEQKEKTNARLA